MMSVFPFGSCRTGVSSEEVKSQAHATYAYYRCVAESVRAHCLHATELGVEATLAVGQWLCTLDFGGGFCAYCQQRSGIILEHFIPLSLGGGTTVGNCVPNCYSCNSRKGNSRPDAVESISREALERVRLYFASQRSCYESGDRSVQPLL